ncbi:4599_t:CDS:2, partial [Gigaspora margarita]
PSPYNDFSYLNNDANEIEITEIMDNQENYKMPMYPIALEMPFNNCWLNNHEIENSFAFTITYSEKDKEDGIPRRCTYRCMKEAHVTEGRNRGYHN